MAAKRLVGDWEDNSDHDGSASAAIHRSPKHRAWLAQRGSRAGEHL
jgi:hypothetical protein